MKKTRLMLSALLALVATAMVPVGCSEIDHYSVTAPDDLQSKIDSIAEAKASKETGDTVSIAITTAIAGAEDCTSAWWGDFSQYFTIPSNRLLHIDFVNHGSGVNNYNNWNLCLATAERDASGYSEYFVLRSDAYGWGNSDYNGNMIGTNYAECATNAGSEDQWAYFRQAINGVNVEMEIDHSKTGNAYVTVKHYAADGNVLIETYEQPVSATDDVVAFLVCDGSYFEVKNAYTITSKVQAVDDQNAVAITATGMPTVLEIGQTDVWGSATATVTFADGSTTEVGADDIDLTLPDLTTVGEKMILYSYSKTKLGNYGSSVAGYYTINVINPVTALEVTKQPDFDTYYVYAQDVLFNTEGLEVTATYADESQSVIDNSSLTFGKVQPGETGTAQVEISYVGTSATVTTTCDVNIIKGTGEVGLSDFTNAWWTTLSENHVVAAGESYEFNMMLYSDNLGNWHSPSVVLRNADLGEYAVVRMDNYGWGDGYATALLESDWNWDTFMTSQNLSLVKITVTNNGNGTADVLYNVTYANGEEHFQKYSGITVDSSDLQAALVPEASYLVLY